MTAKSSATSAAAHAEIVSHHDKVLIVDFGSQVTQLIARRVREAGVYCEIAPFQSAQKAFDALKPEGRHPLGRPGLGDRRGLAARAAGDLRRGPADPRHLLWPADDGRAAGRRGGGRPRREFGRADVEIRETSALFDGVWEVGERYPVWMSHGDRVTQAARGLHRQGDERERALRHRADEKRAHLHHHVPPRGGAHARRREAALQFRAQDRGPRRRLDHGRLPRRGDRRRSARRWARAACICGLSGGVDSVGRRRADPRGDRRPADLRLRRPRPDAHGRGASRSSACSATITTSRWCMWTRARRFLGALDGVTDPETKRKTIGRLFIDVFEAEAKKIASDGKGAPEFLAQGTLYPDVIESVVVHRRPVGHDQEPPQCRRPARAHEHEAGRAAARTLQGRGARARPRARPARGLRRPPSLPRARPRHPHPRRRSRARSSTSCARPTRSISTKSARPASTTTIWQAFAVLLPVRTVGVMGDGRTYDNVCALRAVTSVDGMTADFYPFDMNVPRPRRHAHHQRGEGHQPRGLRRDEQAAGDDRVGIKRHLQ